MSVESAREMWKFFGLDKTAGVRVTEKDGTVTEHNFFCPPMKEFPAQVWDLHKRPPKKKRAR